MNSLTDDVSVIDLGTWSVVGTIPVGKQPFGAAISRDGRTLYVANAGSNSVSVIDVDSQAVVTDVPVGRKPLIVAVAPDGRALYAGNAADGTVSVIDTASRAVRETLAVGGSPIGVGISPDGQRLVADNAAARLVVLDLSTGTVLDRLPVGTQTRRARGIPLRGRRSAPGRASASRRRRHSLQSSRGGVRTAWMLPAALVLLGMGLAARRLLRPSEAGNVPSDRLDGEG